MALKSERGGIFKYHCLPLISLSSYTKILDQIWNCLSVNSKLLSEVSWASGSGSRSGFTQKNRTFYHTNAEFQWRMQDFPNLEHQPVIWPNISKSCMEMKEKVSLSYLVVMYSMVLSGPRVVPAVYLSGVPCTIFRKIDFCFVGHIAYRGGPGSCSLQQSIGSRQSSFTKYLFLHFHFLSTTCLKQFWNYTKNIIINYYLFAKLQSSIKSIK